MGRYFTLFGMALASLWLLVLTSRTIAEYTAAARSKEWPSVEGVIESSYVPRQPGVRVRLYVSYRYEVNGKRYRNKRVQFGSIDGVFAAAEQSKRFPAGAVVPVYHEREAHQNSVLIAGQNEDTRRALMTNLVLCLVFLALWPIVLSQRGDASHENLVLAGRAADADVRKQRAFRKGALLFVVGFLVIVTVVSIFWLPSALLWLLFVGPLAAAQEFLKRPIERLPTGFHRFVARVAILLGWLIFLVLAVAVLRYFDA